MRQGSVKGKGGPLLGQCPAAGGELPICTAAAAALVTRVGDAVTSSSLASSSLGASPKLLYRPAGFQLYPSSKVSPLKLKDAVSVCC